MSLCGFLSVDVIGLQPPLATTKDPSFSLCLAVHCVQHCAVVDTDGKICSSVFLIESFRRESASLFVTVSSLEQPLPASASLSLGAPALIGHKRGPEGA